MIAVLTSTNTTWADVAVAAALIVFGVVAIWWEVRR